MSRRDLGQIDEVEPGIWRVRVSAGRDPLTHSRRRPRATVRGTRRDAERKLAELISSTGKGAVTATNTTLGVYLTSRYIPWLQDRVQAGSLRQNSFEQYERYLLTDAAPLHHTALEDLDPWAIEQWLGKMAGRIGNQSRLHRYRALSTALQRAVKWRLIAANPMVAVDKPVPAKHKARRLTAAEAVTVLDHFVGHRLDLFVHLAIGCGLRRSENLALTWDLYDPAEQSFQIVRAYHGKGRFEEPKAEASTRTVYLPPWAVAAIDRAHPDGPPGSGLVHPGPQGDLPPSPGQVSAAFRRRIATLEGVTVPLKDLRHSFGTLALESGTDIVVVSRALGHAKVGTTTDFYVDPHETSRKDAAVRLGEHLNPTGQGADSVVQRGPQWSSETDSDPARPVKTLAG